jgi:hypothetical protein
MPDAIRGRVHLVSLPMDDIDENAAMVNAQRRADIVVQKSIAEGLTHRRGGDVEAKPWWPGGSAGSRIRSLTAERAAGGSSRPRGGRHGNRQPSGGAERAARIGRAAQQRVMDEFLQIHRLLEYFEHIEELLEAERGPEGRLSGRPVGPGCAAIRCVTTRARHRGDQVSRCSWSDDPAPRARLKAASARSRSRSTASAAGSIAAATAR